MYFLTNSCNKSRHDYFFPFQCSVHFFASHLNEHKVFHFWNSPVKAGYHLLFFLLLFCFWWLHLTCWFFSTHAFLKHQKYNFVHSLSIGIHSFPGWLVVVDNSRTLMLRCNKKLMVFFAFLTFYRIIIRNAILYVTMYDCGVPCVTTVEFFCGKALPKPIALPSCHESSLVFKRDMWWWLWQRVMKGLELDSKHTQFEHSCLLFMWLEFFYVTTELSWKFDHLCLWSSVRALFCLSTFHLFFIFVSYDNLGRKVASCNGRFFLVCLARGKNVSRKRHFNNLHLEVMI